MLKHRRCAKDVDMVPKPEFGHSKKRDTLSNKDKKEIVNVLGQFDEKSPPLKLFAKIKRSRRFTESTIDEHGIIQLVSNSGYSGSHDRDFLHGMCHP